MILALCDALGYYEIQPVPTDLKTGPAMLFDLDDTLYKVGHLQSNRKQLSKQFLAQNVDLNDRAASRMLSGFYKRYDRVAVVGVVNELGLSGAEFEEFIDKRTNLGRKIEPDPELDAFLSNIKLRKYILTNSGLKHAMTVLEALGITQRFHGILYVDYSAPPIHTKPDQEVYKEAMELIGVTDPKLMNFIEDHLSYAQAASKAGWNAVFLDPNLETCPDSELTCIKSIYDLQTVIPNIFV